MRRAFPQIACIIATSLLASSVIAAVVTVFGPQRYARGPGRPAEVTRTFTVNKPKGTYTLRVINDGVTSADIVLNGRTIFDRDDFTRRDRDRDRWENWFWDRAGWNRDDWDRWDRDDPDRQHRDRDDRDRDRKRPVRRLEEQVRLKNGTNRISVTVRSRRGTSFTVEIFGESSSTTDTTPPTISATASPAPNANGWNNTPVTVTFTCSDSGSGIASCPAPVTVSADTPSQVVSGTATDQAGNTASANVTVRIDRVAPTVNAARSPEPNADGWNNTPVTVTFTCVDAASTIATCPAPVVVSADATAQIVSGSATDKAGNSASAQATINLDQTAPTIALALTPPPSANGVYESAVTAHFTCGDTRSGIITCPPDQIVSTDGSHTVTGSVTDRAGNVATITSDPFTITLNITPPTITVSLSPAPNANGWNAGPVTAHFTCTAGGAAIATCPPDQIVATDGEHLTVSGTVTDQAGRSASVTSGPINIDQVPPLITADLGALPAGWLAHPVTVSFTCSDEGGSGIDTCPDTELVSSEGANQTRTGMAIDRAGNTASATSAPFDIDLGLPIVTVTLSPAPNENGWNNGPVSAHFTCEDAASGIATCPADQLVSDEGGSQVIVGTATDVAGNEATVSATINLDLTPPTLLLISPDNGATLFTAVMTATASATDELSGVATASCNGVIAALNGNTLDCAVTLTPGANGLTAAVTDLAGNTSTATLDVTYSRVPVITIASPANLSYQSISPTTVTGTVDDPAATVAINSIQTPVVNGQFSMALPLAEGPNTVTATATAGGAVGTASLEVTLDTTPPHVTITSPPDQFVTSEASISIAGNVNDIVVGTVNDEQARVSVNGGTAQVANRTFLATDVALAIGPNVIQVVGTDRVGNAATTAITVTRQTPAPARIELVSGNNQAAAIGGVLAAPLVIAVTGPTGAPLANAAVIFKVTQNDGLVSAGGVPAPMAMTTTDEDGRAQAQWTIGNRSGAGGNLLEAYSVGVQGRAIFTATGTPGAAGRIVVDNGNDQVGAIGQAVARPFVAVVVDDGHNRLAGVPVTFTVQRGGGTLDGQSSVTVISDSDGRVAATLTLGLEEGNANHVVEANFASNQGLPATFTVSGRAAGNPADTVVSGVVLDNSNMPIPGVIVRAVLTNELHASAAVVQSAIVAQTDEQGQFTIASAPVGLVKVLVDGSTAQPVGTYPILEYDIVTIAGQNNTVGQPIYLVPLSTTNTLCVTATTGGGTLTMADAPGFSLTFGPGQVTFPGGTKEGCVGVTSVHADKVPMSPQFGQQPRFVVTIQPAGAVFNPPASLTIPNVDGLRPREVTEMYSYDHDIVAFVAIGTGVVSDDGLVIRSSPGVGVLKAGWHGAGPTNQTGNVKSPPPPKEEASVSISPGAVTIAVGDTFNFTAVGSPVPGVYDWGLGPTAPGDDPTAATLVAKPACSGQSSCLATVRAVKPGALTLRVHYAVPQKGEASADARITVASFKGLLAPRDNFSGRSTTRFGIAEIINLTSVVLPPATLATLGGLQWRLVSGGGTLIAPAADGLGTYTAPSAPAAVVLRLEIASGPSKGAGIDYRLTVVAPNNARMTLASGIRHTNGFASVGFRGRMNLEPRDVSFARLLWAEGSAIAVASGYYAHFNKIVHAPTVPQIPVAGCNVTTGCQVQGIDTVDTNNGPPPFAVGDFLWPIPWQYKAPGGSLTTFTIANHHQFTDAVGKATIEKKGAGPFSKNVADPTTPY